jgi:hypothetical protein
MDFDQLINVEVRSKWFPAINPSLDRVEVNYRPAVFWYGVSVNSDRDKAGPQSRCEGDTVLVRCKIIAAALYS